MNSVKHEAGRYFRNKYREYLKLKVEDREKKKTNSVYDCTVGDVEYVASILLLS